MQEGANCALLFYFMQYIGDIAKLIHDYPKKEVQIQDGLPFNEHETLKKIDYYYLGQFLSKKKSKFKRFFLNIIKHRVQTATKAIDIDTKHVKVHASEGSSYYKAQIFRVELIDFMKEEGFAEMFNKMAEKWPRYGSVIIKNVNGKPELVMLRNLVRDPALSVEKSPYTLEKMRYSLDEFREKAKEYGWDNVEETIRYYKEAKKDEIQVVEAYMYLSGKHIENENEDEYMRVRIVVAGVEFYGDEKLKDRCKPTELIAPEVFEDELYLELQYDEEEARGQGIGVVEDLFSNQEAWNEVYNLERTGLYWSSKRIFQTRDQTIPKNLFTGVDNGVVFQTNSEIVGVDTSSRAMPEYQSIFERLDKNSNDRAFSHEINTGESLPSGTPWRLGELLASGVTSYYDFKREKFGLFIKKIIKEFVIPEFKKKRNKSHTVRFSGDKEQIIELRQRFAEATLANSLNEYKEQTGKLPTLEEFDKEKERVIEKINGTKEMFLELPDGFYKEIEADIDIVITGEGKDIQSDMATLTTLYQTMVQMGDTRAETILDMIINLTGKDPKGLLGVKQELPAPPTTQQQPQAQAGQANPLLNQLANAQQQGVTTQR